MDHRAGDRRHRRGYRELQRLPRAPPIEGDPIYPTEDIGTGWYVNAAYEHPDVAADLLDFIFFREESRQKMLESGDNVPVGELNLENVDLPVLVQEVSP